jgi:protein-S-isoprenylcysteine O-methyltransferase Ste14
MWGLAYAVLVVGLVVRMQSADAPPPEPVHPLPGEPIWPTRLHHALFALLLVGGPLEALVLGGATRWRTAGLAAFTAGVVLYRVAGQTLGDALSPFVEPRPGTQLVTHGLYRHVRHPIYLGQALIALGAPLTLGARWTLGPAAAALLVIVIRVAREEQALARTFPDYVRYAATTKRIVPFVY